MRRAAPLLVLAIAAAVCALLVARPPHLRAEGASTLHITGLDVGKGEQALVRLHNTARSSSNAFIVHYTIFALDTLNGNAVALSQPGAGNGARLAAGDTLELDLGPIIDAYRARQEAGPWDAPVRFVAFATGGSTEMFGPRTIVAEALQTRRGATYPANVTWTTE